MHDRHQLVGILLERRTHILEQDGLTDWCPHEVHNRAVTFRHLRHAMAELAVRADQRAIPRLEQIGKSGLHAEAAGSGEQAGERVRTRAVHGQQALLNPGVHGEHIGVHVSAHREGQGFGGAGLNRGWAGCQQQLFFHSGPPVPPEARVRLIWRGFKTSPSPDNKKGLCNCTLDQNLSREAGFNG